MELGEVKLTFTPAEIAVSIPFQRKDEIKGLRGARWNSKDKTWRFPATPHAAQLLMEAFEEVAEDRELQRIANPPNLGDEKSSARPSSFQTELWEHQRRAVEASFSRPATMLAMEMRTGKTATALKLATLWDARCILVSCPLSVVGVWAAEITRHSRLPWVVIRLEKGSVAKRTETMHSEIEYAAAATRPAIAIINHEALWREPFGAAAIRIPWDLVIVDESHRAKAPGGKLSRYLARLADRVPRRLALTGTPLPHNPLDAYAQYRFLDRSIFGSSFNRMKNRYAITGGFQGHQIVDWQRMDEFSERFHEIAFEVTTDEAFDLPDEMDIRRSTELEPSARKVYASMEANFFAEVKDGTVTASNALTKLLRLQQVTSGWVKDDSGTMVEVSTAKRKLLADILEDFTTTTPLVIFVRFIADIDAVRRICETSGRIVGEVSGRRKELADDGTFPEGRDVMVVQIQSGSLGVNLSRASTCIFYSWGWSLGDVEQARARIRHSDNVKKLQFIHLVVENSIDDRMMRCLQNRRDFIEDVLEYGRIH